MQGYISQNGYISSRTCTRKRKNGYISSRTCTRKRQNGYISSERVPENAKTGTYYLERVPENAKTGTYHSNERRARIFEKPDVAREKINKTKQSSHQMRKTK